MKKQKKYIFFTGLVALFFLLTACSVPGVTAGSSPTPAQTLQNSSVAMSKLNSVHFDLQQATLNVKANSGTTGITYSVAGNGDAAAPDQVSVTFTSEQRPLFALVSKGQKVYVQLTGGTWYSLDKNELKDSTQNFFSQSLATRLAQIMAILQNAKLTDHGQESVNGASLDHITATLDTQTLQTLGSQLNGMLPANIQSGQNQVQQATLDLWIDQSTWYVHQAKLDIVVQVDASKLSALTGQQPSNSSSTLPVELKARVNFSKFNQPVTIQAPSSAVPFPQ